MAQIAKIESEAQIKSSADQIYGLLKNNLNQLAEILPRRIKSIQLLEGEEGCAGNVRLIKYDLGRPLTVKVKTEAINDEEKSITFEALEGDVMQLYKTFKCNVTVSEGSVKWSFEFEKANDSAPNPDAYAVVGIELSKRMDAYLLNH